MTTEADQELIEEVANSVDTQESAVAVDQRPTDSMSSLVSEGMAALKIMTAANGSAPLEGREQDAPVPLPEEGVVSQELWSSIKELTLADTEDELTHLSTVQQNAAVAHACAAYAALLEPSAQRLVAQQLERDLSCWLTDIFCQPDMVLYVPPDGGDSLPALVKMRLHATYASYGAAGFESLYARPPVIYVSAACRPETITTLMTSLGLPGSAIRQVSLSAVFGAAHAMDVAQLQKMMDEDEAAQKIPLLVLAHAGTPELCHLDNIRRITELCRARGVWCHVTGPNLSALALVHAQPAAAHWGDSLCLDLGAWLDVPCVRPVTLYRASVSAPEAGLPPAPTPLQLLPLWAALKSAGRRGLLERIRTCYALAAGVETRVGAIPSVHILSSRPGKEVAPVRDLDKLLGQAVNSSMALESLSPAVVFRYRNEAIKDLVYLDNLNSWLAQIMQRDLPEVPIQLLDVEGVGFCLKFSPLTGPCRPLAAAALDEWAECLSQQIEILNATVHHRARFEELTTTGALRAVTLTNWAGLGAVRYIPAHLQPLMEAGVTDSGKEDINKLNTDLLTKLKSTDSAFSLGDAEDGMVCIRFGMVTMDTDVEELCSLLLELGGQIEESSRFLETMSEVVMKGIEEASQGLRKENEDRVWQEGVLRHVPLVGTFVNWWSPPPKDAVKGRKLDLAQGIIESTEETYKSHVQIRRASSASNAAGQQHSRSPSSTSGSASASQPPSANASDIKDTAAAMAPAVGDPVAAPAVGDSAAAPAAPAGDASSPAPAAPL